MAAPFVPKIFRVKKNKPLLSFSTLGSLDWTFKKVTDFAMQHNYQGIEFRGLLRQMDLPKCPELQPPKNLLETIPIRKDKDLALVTFGSSRNWNIDDPPEGLKNLGD